MWICMKKALLKDHDTKGFRQGRQQLSTKDLLEGPAGPTWQHAPTIAAMWVCLKIGYIPNYSYLIGIMINNHWV